MEINRHIVPNFFKLLQCQDPALGDEAGVSLQGSIDTLVEAADKKVVDPELSPVTDTLTPIHHRARIFLGEACLWSIYI